MNPFIKALNAGLDAVHHALERQAPIIDDEPECDTCMGFKTIIGSDLKRRPCPTCKGKGTTWKNN